MRTNEPYKIKMGKINSLDGLEKEKERLQLEIIRKEEGIKYSYQSLVHLLTFSNLIGSFIEEVNATSSLIGKVISLGKDFFVKHKKKQKVRQKIAAETKSE